MCACAHQVGGQLVLVGGGVQVDVERVPLAVVRVQVQYARRRLRVALAEQQVSATQVPELLYTVTAAVTAAPQSRIIRYSLGPILQRAGIIREHQLI